MDRRGIVQVFLMKAVPQWLSAALGAPPKSGDGLHAWLFSMARQLHAHMPKEAIAAILTNATANAARHVTPREIADAVNNSEEVAWTPKGEKREQTAKTAPRPRTRENWPKVSTRSRAWIIAKTNRAHVIATRRKFALGFLWDYSPNPVPDICVDDWLDVLFPGAEWLCLAQDKASDAITRKREQWSFGPAEKCSLIVPSPMTARTGKRQDGQTSNRCLENTGPRRWLVIEFDSGSIDEQAALHWYLSSLADALGWPPLGLVVHSAGKSLHGWYRVTDDAVARELMAYAVSLGADPATWVPCQFIRLPNGIRRNCKPEPEETTELPDWATPQPTTRRQAVLFYSRSTCLI